MKKVFAVSAILFAFVYYNVDAQVKCAFEDNLIDKVIPKGWLKDFLENQRDGMTGHPESMSYPYDSNLWDGEIVRNTTSYGSDWWRYEQTAYYTDGLLRLSYLLDDAFLAAAAEAGIKYTLQNPDSTGRLPHSAFKSASMWPMAVFWRAIKAYYDRTEDENIPKILERHYLSYTTDELEKWRNIVSIEGMLWTYGKTGNKELLERCEQAWNRGKFSDLTPEACFSDQTPFMHGVTFCEELKLPLLLYSYTGNSYYLDAALNAYKVMERDHMLPDGIPSSAEALLGNGNIINSHETCDITDLTWTMGYFLQITGDPVWADRIEKAIFNAGMGAVTKDFKALQYFSSVNQFRVTGDSNHNGFFHGSTWMAYRPTHQTECCAGNVHRFMPNYAARMWMESGEDGIASTLYGPSEVSLKMTDGALVNIVEETSYPYSDRIIFRFKSDKKTALNFYFRVPDWADNASAELNGRSIRSENLKKDAFNKLEVDIDGKEVIFELVLPMKPVLKRLGHGCNAYDTVAERYFKKRGGVEPASVRNEKAECKDEDVDDVTAVYVQRGPLLYAYPIPQTITEDKTIYPNMNGKMPGDTTFKCLSIEPSGQWNYAVDMTQEPELVYVPEKDVVRIPVKSIAWNLAEGRYTPKVPAPDEVVVMGNGVSHIDLVPYGGTLLRLTVFPVILQREVYGTSEYVWSEERVSSDTLTAFAPTVMSLKTNALSRKGEPLGWTCRNDISKYGVFKGNSTLETALYNLAVDEMVNNIEKDGTLRTGALWGGVWTRDVSYSAILSLSYMVPENVMTSLKVKIDEQGRIIQDTGTGGSWPCSSDRVIWAVAAWKVYLATGDMQWLRKAYSVVLKSLESDHHALYDSKTGLYRGESSFIDWRQQSYPLWMQPADIYMSECLGTNVVYAKVFETVASMAGELGEKSVAKEYRGRAADLRKAINDNFWLSDKGYYGSFLYGRNSLIQSGRSETLGESLAILWDVADSDRSEQIISSMPVSAWGPAIFWPQISSQPDYHNNATWPFVTSYYGMAAAKAGNQRALLHALGSNVRSAALYATNYENFTNSTGNPYTTRMNSHNMLWGLSGFMGLFHKVFFGMELTEDGMWFSPCVPESLEGERSLTGFPYRGMLLDIKVSGRGNRIKTFCLDGRRQSKAFVPASLTGTHQVTIELTGEFSESSVDIQEYTPAPEYPSVSVQGGELVWNAVGKCSYKVLRDGNVVAETSEFRFVLPEDNAGEWQVVSVDENGVAGFASEPLEIYPLTVSVPVDVKIDEIKGEQVSVTVDVPEDGEYVLDWLYSNGNGSVTGYNHCSTRTLYVDTQMVGVSVFPQRGKNDWKAAGWSSPVAVKLTKGAHTVALRYLDTDVNMNIRKDNAHVRELRLKQL